MGLITERALVERMRLLYRQRLNEVLGEADAASKVTGKVLPSVGLKVRHKESGFEYTVGALQTTEGGRQLVSLTLMPPEAPRFEPTSGEAFIGEETPTPGSDVRALTHDQKISAQVSSRGPRVNYEPLVVSREQYEKDYEVR